jgi:hypothetical protein
MVRLNLIFCSQMCTRQKALLESSVTGALSRLHSIEVKAGGCLNGACGAAEVNNDRGGCSDHKHNPVMAQPGQPVA